MDITATAKNIRVSPQKVRLLVGQIKKMAPTDAVQILDYLPQKSSPLLKKVISSAIANAKNNYQIAEETLKFKEIQVGRGPMFKRYRAVARGRAHSILKRTSHITVVVTGEKNAPKNELPEKNNQPKELAGRNTITLQKATKEGKETKNGPKS